jgi:hypothetical protein
MNNEEVIFEFRKIADMVKIAAVHGQTGREITISVPASLSKEEMKQIAVKRLIYVMKKESE